MTNHTLWSDTANTQYIIVIIYCENDTASRSLSAAICLLPKLSITIA